MTTDSPSPSIIPLESLRLPPAETIKGMESQDKHNSIMSLSLLFVLCFCTLTAVSTTLAMLVHVLCRRLS
jgi:hypothetical protein